MNDRLDEVLIDEVRLPRMARTLRQAGLMRRCGCSGCAPCRDQARRVLTGLARNARYVGDYRADRWGTRFPVFSRPLGGRLLRLLVDGAAPEPTVVDVNLQAPAGDVDADATAAPDDAGLTAGAAADGGAAQAQEEVLVQRSRLSATHPQGGNLLAGLPAPVQPYLDGWEPVAWHDVLDRARWGRWQTALTTGAGVHRGLYLIQWGSTAYLGKAEQDIRSRLQDHLRCIETFWPHGSAQPPNAVYRIWVRFIPGSTPTTREVEKSLLDTVHAAIARVLKRSTPVGEVLRAAGLANRQREFEIPPCPDLLLAGRAGP